MKTSTCLNDLKRIVLAWLLGVILVGAIATCGARAEEQGTPLQLVTAEEAALPASRSFGFSTPQPDSGPVITTPEMEATESKPFSLRIGVAPRGGVAVNPASLKMEYLKTPAVDLSIRVRPYVTQEGVKIERVTLPAGLHHFRLSVSDAEGRLSQKDFVIVVSAKF